LKEESPDIFALNEEIKVPQYKSEIYENRVFFSFLITALIWIAGYYWNDAIKMKYDVQYILEHKNSSPSITLPKIHPDGMVRIALDSLSSVKNTWFKGTSESDIAAFWVMFVRLVWTLYSTGGEK